MTHRIFKHDGMGWSRAGVALALALAFGLATGAARADIWQLPSAPSQANPKKPASDGLRPAAPTAAEPEADDTHYARICDAFGEGFTYSPGTGTCIKIAGYVKFGTAFGGRH